MSMEGGQTRRPVWPPAPNRRDHGRLASSRRRFQGRRVFPLQWAGWPREKKGGEALAEKPGGWSAPGLRTADRSRMAPCAVTDGSTPNDPVWSGGAMKPGLADQGRVALSAIAHRGLSARVWLRVVPGVAGGMLAEHALCWADRCAGGRLT